MTEVRYGPALSRPVLRWHGGKWVLAPWIIQHLPVHRVYVEPFGGAASVLLRKPRVYAEVYNDLESEVVNLFRVLRDRTSANMLIAALRLTPWAREEFEAAYQPAEDRIERARRLVVRSFMGFGSDGVRLDKNTGFRANSNRSGTTPAGDWRNYPDALAAIVERLVGVVIENRDAWACMAQHDGPDTLFFVDPPYLPTTRRLSHRANGYEHELTAEDHIRLLVALRDLSGMVVLSGYPHPFYDVALCGWMRMERPSFADGASPRTEVLWLNPRAAVSLRQPHLFAQEAVG